MEANSTLINIKDGVKANKDNKVNHVLLTVSAKRISFTLIIVMLILTFLHLASVWLIHYDASSKVFNQLNKNLNLNNEGNFPNYFSSGILLLVSSLLYFIYKLCDRISGIKGHWLFLSRIFLFLSADEAIGIHEQINELLHIYIKNDFSGFLFWIWIVPYVLLAAAVGLNCLRFIKRLPNATRNNFMISGFVYVFSAAGIESLEGYLINVLKGYRYITFITTTSQEILEMASVILFIYGLLKYIEITYPNVQLVTIRN